MKKIVFISCILFGVSVNGQGYDFQQLCLDCATQGGVYCGDDESNWTQCVQSSWINDGWEDCIDASDENGATSTIPADCVPDEVPCDTVYVEIPVIEYIYETIFEIDTITEYVVDTIIEIEYTDVYITEYIDCDTGTPCNTNIPEIIKKSEGDNRMYNLMGQVIRRPESIYIQDGKIKYIMN